MSQRASHDWGRRASAATLALLVAALIVGQGGCEAIVPGSIEAFRCGSNLLSACPTGQMCATSTGQCIAAAQTCTVTGCTAPEVCDPGSLMCMAQGAPPGADASMVDSALSPVDTGASMPDTSRPSPPMDAKPPPADVSVPDASCGVGCTCTSSDGCGQGLFCPDTGVIDVLMGAKICTMTCCSSADCPNGSVCYATGGPGNFCVPPSYVGITSVGQGIGGDTCADGTTCRSGVCDTTTGAGHCLDTCCPSTMCAQDSYCALDATPPSNGHLAFYCLWEASPGESPGEECLDPTDCTSNFCAEETLSCTASCCGATDCASTGAGTACVSGTFTGSNDVVNVCGDGATGAAFGKSCASGNDCASQVCDPGSSTCTDVCCVDKDCMSGHGNSYVCRPMSASPYTLICVRGG